MLDLDPPTVMRIVAERTQKLAGADGAVIDLIEGDEIVHRFAAGEASACVGRRIKMASSLGGAAIRERKVIRCDDAETDQRVNRDAYAAGGMRSMVVAPLIQHDGPVGVLRVLSRRAAAFNDLDVTAVRLMAGVAAGALRNASEMAAKEQLLGERSNALASLAESEQRFRLAFDHAPIGMALVSPEGHWLRVNQSLCEIVGYTEAELLATDFQSITHPDDLEADLGHVRELLAGERRSYRLLKRYFHKRGQTVWIALAVSIVNDPAGRPLYLISQIQDVTESKKAEQLEEDRSTILEMVAQDKPLNPVLVRLTEMVERQLPGTICTVLLLHEGTFQHVAPGLPGIMIEAIRPVALSLASALCTSPGGQLDGLIASDIAADPRWAPLRAAALDSGLKACWSVPVRSHDQTFLALLNVYSDSNSMTADEVSRVLRAAARVAVIAIEHFQVTRQLSHLARHDVLTGLPNRMVFEDRLQQAISVAGRDKHLVGLLVLDLDHFKTVNDTLGHAAGDTLLQQFARRAQSVLRQSDTLARIGGDEFVLVLPKIAAKGDAEAVARKLVEILDRPFVIASYEIKMTGSIGVSVFPGDGGDAATLQQAADAAMYQVKRHTRNGFAIANPTSPT